MQTLNDIRIAVASGKQGEMADMLSDLVKQFETGEGLRRRRLWERYSQEHVPINARRVSNPHKVIERLPHDFYGDVVDTKTGYMGNEVTITVDRAAYEDEALFARHMALVDRYQYINDSEDDNNELVKMAAACGVAYRLLYVPDGAQQVYQLRLNSWETRLYYDVDTDTPEYGMVVRTMTVVEGDYERTMHEVDWYDSKGIEYWRDNGDYEFVPVFERGLVEQDEDGEDVSTNRVPHLFGEVPIIEFPNNGELRAEPEKAVPLIDAYDVVVSATTEEIEQFRHAYLLLRGAGLTIDNEVLKAFEQTGIIPVDSDGDARFVVKELNKDAVEWLLGELRRSIYKFSKSIDLSKDFGGDLRVIGWQVALLPLENSCKVTERKFKRALRRQYRMVADKWFVWSREAVDVEDLAFTFTRNMPQDTSGEIEMVSKGIGSFSRKTLYEQVSFIDDPEREMVQLQEEQESAGAGLMEMFDAGDTADESAAEE